MRLFAIGLVCLMASSAYGATIDVKGIRTWSAPDHTRVVLDIDRPVDYALFVLRDPDRVVVDLSGARLLKRVPGARPGDRLLSRIRAAQRKRVESRARDGIKNDLRVVLDMKQRVRPKSFLLKPNSKYGHRLVIDVYPVGGEADRTVVRKQGADGAPKGSREVVVAVDAGHGGEDPGAMTRSGIREKEVVLAISRALKRRIDRTPGMRAVLIRNGDYYVGLRRRTEIARRQGADLFVSVHADSFRDPRVSGSSVYVLSRRGASSEAARWLAQQENASDFVGGVSIDDKDDLLASVLVDLQQTATLNASAEVGGQVLTVARPSRAQAQAPDRAGGLSGPEVARYPLDPHRNGLSHESVRREAPVEFEAPGKGRTRHTRRHSPVLRSQPAARHHVRIGAAPHHCARRDIVRNRGQVPGLGRAAASCEPNRRKHHPGRRRAAHSRALGRVTPRRGSVSGYPPSRDPA